MIINTQTWGCTMFFFETNNDREPLLTKAEIAIGATALVISLALLWWAVSLLPTGGF